MSRSHLEGPEILTQKSELATINNRAPTESLPTGREMTFPANSLRLPVGGMVCYDWPGDWESEE